MSEMKKHKKAFTRSEYVPLVPAALTKRTKVFCFFFSKKKYFLASPVLAFFLAAAAPEDVNALLSALKSAPTEQQATLLEQRLVAAWLDQATPAVQILIEQAARKAADAHARDALADADAAIVLQPDLADLWRRRAELRYATGDEAGAIADLAQALSREPRLIPAWASLSLFAEARHDPKRALAAWQKVLELDPKTAHAATRLELLQRKVNGQPI
jgi:tetratricopeptide (TPR) repeat protein